MEEKYKNSFKYFENRDCKYYPCHKAEHINCLFCYCPLYTLGSGCGGNFKYLENGVKDCSGCLRPHRRDSYGYIMSRYPELMELAKKNK